ncbi:MAG: hypothetical protein KBC45_08475 [Pseudomonas sp.]|uniref:hypothetical protein n=1 Tax=Pseudomonas sp. TaxID=306 RepID=UPI001B644369|nr:hypothetical protein [Pseudomonas sp.]MBP6954446.1 hypothetical protein [Pseudomonas sp.]
MAYNTGNPVEPNGSTDPRDLRDNVQILDKLVNSSDLSWTGRLGKTLKTWAGMEKDFSDLLLRSGFESAYVLYAAGAVVQRPTQLIERAGELYRVTSQADLPLTLTGVWATDQAKLTAVGDQGLRARLAAPDGGAIIGVGQSTLDVELSAAVSAESLGAFPDGSNVSTILQAALAAGKVVRLAPNKTYVATGLVSSPGAGLVCEGGIATIRDVAGTNTTTLKINTPDFDLVGVEFDGGNEGPYKFFSSQPGTRKGVVIGNPTGTNVQLTNVRVRNVIAHGYDYIGIEGLETVIGFSFGHRVVFENVNVHHCYVNWWLKELFEYSTGTNCYGYEGFVGMLMVGGNNTFVASNFEENFNNLQMAGGYNHAHGKFIGCSFNHAADGGLGFIGNGVVNGHTFVGCTFWYSPITLSGCAGISITQSQIVYGKVIIAGGGLNNIDDNYTPQGLVKEFTGNTFTTFRRNRVSYNTVLLNAVYGDLAMRSVASSTLPYPISFANTSGAGIPLTFELKKWNGEDASFLEQFGGAYIPKTAMYQVDMSVRFTTLGVGERPVLTLQILDSEGNPSYEIVESREFSASQADCVVSLSKRIFLTANQYLRMQLRTKTSTGITIPSGGIYMLITSID